MSGQLLEAIHRRPEDPRQRLRVFRFEAHEALDLGALDERLESRRDRPMELGSEELAVAAAQGVVPEVERRVDEAAARETP